MTLHKPSVKDNFLAFLAIIIVLSTLLIPREVVDREQLGRNRTGYPISFVVQDLSFFSIGETDSPPFPYSFPLMSIWDYPARFLWINFFASLLTVYLLLKLLAYGFGRLLSTSTTALHE